MFRKLTIKAKLSFVIGLMSLVIILIGGLGMKGMLDMEQGLQTIYSGQLLPSQQIATINDLMRSDIQSLYGMSVLDPRLNEGELDADGIGDHAADIEANIEFTNQLWDAYLRTERSAAEQELATSFQQERQAYVDEALMPAVRLYQAGEFDEANRQLRSAVRAYEDAAYVSQDLLSLQIEDAQQIFEAAQAQYTQLRNVVLGAAVGGVLLALVVGWLIVRAIVRPAQQAISVFQSIGQGQLDAVIDIRSDDEMGQILSNLKGMQQQLREQLDAERQLAAENRRVRDALTAVSGAVMIADADLQIIHMNPAAQHLFREHEEALRRDVPELSAEDMIGSRLGMFHPDPEAYAQLLAELEESRTVTLDFGGRMMQLVTSPISNEEGERIGYVIEWTDKTDQIAAEREVEMLVEAAANGNFEQRMDVASAQGFFRTLGESVNRLMDVTDQNLAEVVRVLQALARGDLTERVDGEFKGAFALLQASTNESMDQLERLISQVRTAGDAIASGSSEIAAGNMNLSQRTEEQAASLEETASSMEEMTTTVRQNADNARQANQLAQGAREVANKGGDKVRDVVASMSAITDSARKIENIISVIDGIAFQTNILALNAAVEAARAGEQGRGFAVVAGEVRTLAQRSAEAAKEIKGLITDSVQNVEGGSALVEEAGATMEEIVNSIKRVTDIMGEISAASMEQSQGIEQVNTTVTQLDEMTQQNAALVEQATAAAGSMEEQARLLSQAVAVFQLRNAANAGLAAATEVSHAGYGAANGAAARGASNGAGNLTADGATRGSVNGAAAATSEQDEYAQTAAGPKPSRKVHAVPAVVTTGDDEWAEF